jgi:hypothetical protein
VLGPPIAEGDTFTVTLSVLMQPAVLLYVIVVVPGAIPVKNPVLEPIVPTSGLLLIQVPPVGVLT